MGAGCPCRHNPGILLFSGEARFVSGKETLLGYVLNCFADHFDCLDSKNRPILTEREILRNLKAIVADADQTPANEVTG